MVLAHNKNILKYIHDAIKHRNIATVGYYIGGMKEQALKETESKMVVIATYAMAAEALDIKTLTTLIMATPKTDIEQSVGRILREKHSSPIVVDIVDSHNTFKNQWRKRKTFYKKENYKIIYTTSPEYNPDTSVNSWTLVFNPLSNYCINKLDKKDKNDKKNISVKSNSSSDKSIANDSDDEEEVVVEEGPKDKYAPGVCLLKFKK
jgi:superfamily II DNA or RNA helicase